MFRTLLHILFYQMCDKKLKDVIDEDVPIISVVVPYHSRVLYGDGLLNIRRREKYLFFF